MSVYFIQAGSAVKIGHSVNPQRRLSQLQTGSAKRLRLLAAIDGGKAEEDAIHARFAGLRIIGEMFRLTDDVKQFIASRTSYGSR